MFGSAFDDSAIQCVFEANHCDLARTIDALLLLQNDAPSQQRSTVPSLQLPDTTMWEVTAPRYVSADVMRQIEADERLARQLQERDQQITNWRRYIRGESMETPPEQHSTSQVHLNHQCTSNL